MVEGVEIHSRPTRCEGVKHVSVHQTHREDCEGASEWWHLDARTLGHDDLDEGASRNDACEADSRSWGSCDHWTCVASDAEH